MYIRKCDQDMIRAKIYLLIEDRDLAKQVSHNVIMDIINHKPSPEVVEIRFLIPMPIRTRESICKSLPDKLISSQVITLFRIYDMEHKEYWALQKE